MARSTRSPALSLLHALPPSLRLPLGLCLAVFLLSLCRPASAQVAFAGTTENSTATYYGGTNAAGTSIPAACGYGNLLTTPIGYMNAAASVAIWAGGAICGACFEATCVNSKWCRNGAKVVVTVTNLCPEGSEGGWCNNPKHHLDMAYPAWIKLATDKVAGVIPTSMRRVQCPVAGGIRFRFSGNPWWTAIRVINVGGSGDLASVDVSVDRGANWAALKREWGIVWSYGALGGMGLSFRLRTGLSNQTLVIKDAVPATWKLGSEYATAANFPKVATK